MADFAFVPPPWLQGQDTDTIHARMMANLPEDIDDTEGGFPWDFTRPSALEMAELLEFQMVENLRAMFYQFAGCLMFGFHYTLQIMNTIILMVKSVVNCCRHLSAGFITAA